jgi:signal transduction histidine kinase
MSSNGIRPAALPLSLQRLRLRLTAWYVGTFFAILALLGIGMFATITRRFDRDLDASLVVATHELVSAARAPVRSGDAERSTVAEAVGNLRIPDRTLFVFDSAGQSLSRRAVDPWMAALARTAFATGAGDTTLRLPEERQLRVHAERFALPDGRKLVAIALADEIELEDRYASLIAAFGAAAFASLVLVAAGGWFLARQSTAPVERAIVHMRRFMADAAHELRTPITVVRSRAEIALQRTREPEEYLQALRGIERESARLGRIVEDLLMLARADTGERPLERHRVFLDDVTLDAAEAARAIADRKSVRLEVDSFEEAPVVGDPDLLRQLVMILLDNAVKFTPANGVVRVGVQAGASVATLTVTDTGVGIASDQLPHVFERFYRGDPSRTRGLTTSAGTSEGAGLGLSIAQWIAEEHGATIRVESTPRQGTIAVVQFPIAGTSDNLSSS